MKKKKNKLLFWINIILSLFIIGEVLALTIGMHLSFKENSNWFTFKNYLILSIDIIMGFILIIYTLKDSDNNYLIYIIVVSLIIIISHLYRDIEYFYNISDKFYFNIQLLIVNNLKFILSIICLSSAIFIHMNN
ncbi:MAG: hypothetical protein JXA99_15935 [Candidatus Lokiarchaeota archaeon]|nr:hypothetical protein [Candidatus Lokiarchaeota archaeon]